MDSDAQNYSSEAKTTDGSCTYQGSCIIWYGQNTANELLNYGSNSLNYYVDDKLVGSSATSYYFPSAPDCDQNGIIKVTKDLGSSKSKISTYKVIDDFGDVIWEGTIEITGNSCFKLELVP